MPPNCLSCNLICLLPLKIDLIVTRQQWTLVKARTGCHSSPAREVPYHNAVVSGPIRQAPAHV